MSNKIIAMAGFSLIVLGGCAQPESLSSDFGDAVRHNMAAQTVNPTPKVAAVPPTMNGNRAALAHGRYQAGVVKEPKGDNTRKSGSAK